MEPSLMSETDAPSIRLRHAADAAELGTWECAVPQGPVVFDDAAAAMLELPPNRSVPLARLLDVVVPEDRASLEAAITRGWDGGRVAVECHVPPTSERHRRAVWLLGGAVPGKTGDRLLAGIVVPQHLAPERNQTSEHLAAIVASSEDAIIGGDLDGRVRTWNGAAERLFGYTAEEVIDTPIRFLVPPGYEDEMPGVISRIEKGARVEHYETRRRRKDGQLLDLSVTVSPIRDEAGRVIGVSKSARDITGARRAAEALRGAESRLVALEQELVHVARLGALGQVAALLGHELNQPLTAIVNYLRAAQRLFARRDEAVLPRVGEAMGRAIEQAERAAEIIRGLRALAAGEVAERQKTELQPLLAEALRLAAGGDGEQQIDVRLTVDPTCPLVLIDPLLIRQVGVDLIRNAVESLAHLGRRAIAVEARPVPEEGTVEVAVTDTGPGLSPEVTARLFQPFITTKRDALGGGLSICRSIVEAHGGRLWAEANPGGGTSFRFTLPAAPAS